LTPPFTSPPRRDSPGAALKKLSLQLKAGDPWAAQDSFALVDALLADVELLRSVRARVACLRSRRLRLRRRARTGAAADMC